MFKKRFLFDQSRQRFTIPHVMETDSSQFNLLFLIPRQKSIFFCIYNTEKHSLESESEIAETMESYQFLPIYCIQAYGLIKSSLKLGPSSNGKG